MRRKIESSQDWEQTMLLVPEVLELTLRVGLVVSTEHAQFQLEVMDPSTQELVALVARPHVKFGDVDGVLRVLLGELTEFVEKWTGPFPA